MMPSRRSQASARESSTSKSSGDPGALTATQIRDLARRHGVRPSKSLGQNFVIDQNTVRRIVRLAEVEPTDDVVEIGAGFGSLTLALAGVARWVKAIEFDHRLVTALQETTAALSNVEVVSGDALDVDYRSLLDGRPHRFISNLPYNIATPLIAQLLEDVPEFIDFVVLVQREVGERLTASVGSKAYGAVSVLVAYHCATEVLGKVPPTVFWPPPKVESILVRLSRIPPTVETPSKELMTVVRAAFSQRRKTLRNALSSVLAIDVQRVEGVLEQAGIPASARAEELGVEDFDRLARSLALP